MKTILKKLLCLTMALLLLSAIPMNVFAYDNWDDDWPPVEDPHLYPCFFMVYTVDVNPTCTTAGSEHARCSYGCDAIDVRTIAPLGHTYEDGFCIRCNRADPVGCAHNYVDNICSFCGFADQTSCSHSYATGEKIQYATCTESALSAKRCTLCNYVVYDISPPLGHKSTTEILTAPTCTEEGTGLSTCTRCGIERTTTLFPTGHTFSNEACTTCGACDHLYTVSWPEDAVCLEESVRTSTCTRCGEILQETFSITPHNFSGLFCKRCNVSRNIHYTASYYPDGTCQVIDFSMGGGLIEKIPETLNGFTVTSLGTQSMYPTTYSTMILPTTIETIYPDVFSSSCITFSGDAPKIALDATCYNRTATIVKFPADNPTYTQEYRDGVDYAVWRCLEHTMEQSVYTEATCTTYGVDQYRCTVCNYWELKDVPPTGHSFEDCVCTSCSLCVHTYENGTCNVCGLTCTHSFDNGTCTVCGLTCTHSFDNGTCTVCGIVCSHVFDNETCVNCSFICTHNYVDSICALCGTIEPGFTYVVLNETECAISGYTGNEATVVIPEELDGYTVTRINSVVFKGNSTIQSVVIGDTVKEIGGETFMGCTSLRNITIGSGVESIWGNAFADCPIENLTFNCTGATVGMDAFIGSHTNNLYLTDLQGWCETDFSYYELWDQMVCTASPMGYTTNLYVDGQLVTDLVLPQGTTTVGSITFAGIRTINSVTFPDSVTTIEEYAFYDSTSTKTITFQGNAPAIGTGAFSGITATAFYPLGDETWTEDVRGSYGGNLTWEAYCPEHSYVDGTCEHCGEAQPATLSGNIQAPGEATVQLYVNGEEAPAYTATVTGGAYSFEGVATGEYTLRIECEGAVTREYPVTINAGENVQDAQVYLVGDINSDGEVNIGDVAQLYTYAKDGTQPEGYSAQCADLNGDGIINIGDVAKAYAETKA